MTSNVLNLGSSTLESVFPETVDWLPLEIAYCQDPLIGCAWAKQPPLQTQFDDTCGNYFCGSDIQMNIYITVSNHKYS